jgi:hypothetical protein
MEKYVTGILKDTVGELGKRGKMGSGGAYVLESTFTVANGGGNRSDRSTAFGSE